MHRLKELTINSTGIRERPLSIGNLRGLESLDLNGCEDLLEKLPKNIGDLQELSKLDARETVISRPPPSITKLGKLWMLNISHVLQHVHQLSALSFLNEFDPTDRNILGERHEDLGSLQSLEYLHCGHEKSECRTVSYEQVDVKKLLQHFLKACIQCDYNQRAYFLISFPEVRILEFFDYQFINQEMVSINLNPSWYANKFTGFSILYCPNGVEVRLLARLVCKSDPESKHR
ncbi:hypothetical protein T459_30886 [Capsicum annuum]|uniref:TMV resistance protein N-like n=1 Tax=Capsicum annuum TaxID=4072 RepID=A0A2G2YA83_CAPAN|nr:hypothetical protein T459_30886 [Capsicum annuum]